MKKPNFPEPVQNVLRDSGLRSRYMLNLSLMMLIKSGSIKKPFKTDAH